MIFRDPAIATYVQTLVVLAGVAVSAGAIYFQRKSARELSAKASANDADGRTPHRVDNDVDPLPDRGGTRSPPPASGVYMDSGSPPAKKTFQDGRIRILSENAKTHHRA